MMNIHSASQVFLETLFLSVALTQSNYPVNLAYEMLDELQQKIYSVYPKVRISEDEQIAGARIFVSDICQRYNSKVSSAQDQKEHEAEAIAEKRAEEFAAKLKSNMNRMMGPVEETKVTRI